MSYNVRTVTFNGDPVDDFELRKGPLVRHIKANDPDLLGTQEVLSMFWDEYLIENLKNYTGVGIARDGEGMPFSEKNMIFFKIAKFDLLESGTFWLSDTPDIVSRGWDGYCNRICTWVRLKDKSTGKTFMYFNTHLDHMGTEAREKGSALVAQRVSECGCPAILTGDFNFYESSVYYQNMVAALDDTKYLAVQTMDYGSYHGYKERDLTGISPIDYCMVTKGDFSVLSYEVLHEKYEDVFTSDHYPIKIIITL
jgi:endonuclease/exonuclease/phosphatase family metal-dependent hydrolase